jgi:hypothetical protein
MSSFMGPLRSASAGCRFHLLDNGGWSMRHHVDCHWRSFRHHLLSSLLFCCRTRPVRSAFNVRRLVARPPNAPASHRSAGGEIEFLPFLLVHVLQSAEQKESTGRYGGGQQQHPRHPPSGGLFSQESFYFPSHFAVGTAVSFGCSRPLLNLKVKRRLQRTGRLDSSKTFRL